MYNYYYGYCVDRLPCGQCRHTGKYCYGAQYPGCGYWPVSITTTGTGETVTTKDITIKAGDIEQGETVTESWNDVVNRVLSDMGIVHCKDCKHSYEVSHNLYCKKFGDKYFPDNGFCSYGVRKEDGESKA